jgi:hypothetical protein
VRKPTGAIEISLDAWNQALFDELFPPVRELGCPTVLACDDETVRATARRLGLPVLGGVSSLVQVIKLAHHINPQNGLKELTLIGSAFRKAQRPRPIPPFLADLCLLVLAASRMSPEEMRPTNAYYPILRDLLGLHGDTGEIVGFWYVKQLFPILAGWFREDLGGRYGDLILPADPTPKFVGWPVSQTVFRQRDREVLTDFFDAKLRRAHDGVDRRRLLRRWSGRHHLTRHALAMLADDAVSGLVGAAIDSAHRSWDSSVLQSDGRRSWPGRLRLERDGPRLLVSTLSRDVIRFRTQGQILTLHVGGDAVLPWQVLAAASTASVTLPIEGSNDTIRIPQLGSTVLFEVREDAASGATGLWRVTSPETDLLWILTKDGDLMAALHAYRDPWAKGLPHPWALLQKVPAAELPQALREAPDDDAAPIALLGGLPVERLTYLLGGGPELAAGTFEDDRPLVVLVDGVGIGLLYSNGRCPIPADCVGLHRVVVAEGLYVCEYEIVASGVHRPGYGDLRYLLDHSSALMRGAVPDRDGAALTITGAVMSPPPPVSLPIMRMSSPSVFTISAAGAGTRHDRVARPAWLSFPEIKGGDRWEVADDGGVAWVVCPQTAKVVRWRPMTMATLDETAATAVVQTGADAVVDAHGGVLAEARIAWSELVRLATSVVGA